ncbi:hypothetical protein Glove_81g27 [Diversispora epigaea]|uniref:Transmembrane protein n=1 Tax=Diversispora epigaea TaxID=1348612 RepID=A0A397JHK8_9GLOM|nr:hypothetical protein Glove_81g27 [Diversispora epigaea]
MQAWYGRNNTDSKELSIYQLEQELREIHKSKTNEADRVEIKEAEEFSKNQTTTITPTNYKTHLIHKQFIPVDFSIYKSSRIFLSINANIENERTKRSKNVQISITVFIFGGGFLIFAQNAIYMILWGLKYFYPKNYRKVFPRDTIFWLTKTTYNSYCCLSAAWFLAVKLEEGNPSAYYIIQAMNRIMLSFILTFRTYQIYKSTHSRNNDGNLISSVFINRKVVLLATFCLIIQLIFEGIFLGILFQVNCANSDFTECKTKIDSKLESNGFTNTAPSYAAMVLALISLLGIVIRLENKYQLMVNDQQSLIRFSQGWNIGGIIVICLYHICRIVYWSCKGVDQSILQLVLLGLRVLISYFITYDIYFANENSVFYLNLQKGEGIFLGILFQVNCANSDFTECKTKIDSKLESNGFTNTAPSYAAMVLALISLLGIVIRLENKYQLMVNDQQSLIRFSQGWNIGGIIVICLYHICRIVYWSCKGVDQSILQLVLLGLRVLISYFITYDIYFANENSVFYLNLQKGEV